MDCVLKLNQLIFDEILFKRLGKKNDNELEMSFSISVGTNMTDNNLKKVTIKISGIKKDEYTFDVQASGYFEYEGDAEDTIIQQNAVAIVMPYLRSEISLLTAQPGVDTVIMPPLNIASLLSESKEN